MKFVKQGSKSQLMGIYKIVNLINNKVYVGSSKSLQYRINTHFRKLRSGKHDNYLLQNDWNKHGEDNFKVEVLKYVGKQTDLPLNEKNEILKYKENDGVYNISDPTVEKIRGRFKNEKKKYKNTKKYINNRNAIIDWLNENLIEKMDLLNEHIDSRKFYIKENVDTYFVTKVLEQFEVEGEHLIEILKKWYNKNKLCVISAQMYKYQIKTLYKKQIEHDGFLLVNNQIRRELYEKKFKKSGYQF